MGEAVLGLTLGLGLAAALVAVLRRAFAAVLQARVDRHVPRTGWRPDQERRSGVVSGGDLVVFLHGTFCDARTTRFLAEGLEAAGWPVWVYEYRYLDPIEANARLFEEDLERRLAGLGRSGPGRLLLVGYSQGGLLLRWLLAGQGHATWLARVVGLIQIATPNGGTPVAPLARLGWVPGGVPAPALRAMEPASGFLDELDRRPLMAGVGFGLIYGHGPGRHLLERFFLGRVREHPVTIWLGALYERILLPGGEHDGLVPTESALRIYAQPGLEGEPAPVRIETDHLGLLVDPRAREALVELGRRLVASTRAADRPV